MVNVEDALLGAGLVLLGFVITALWELYKRRTESKQERRRLIETIRAETAENMASSKGLADAFGKGQLAPISTIPLMRTQVGLVAVSNWIVLKLPSDTATLLSAAYALTEGINATIRARENFQITQIALSSYQQIMNGLNNTLIAKCNQYVSEHEKLWKALDAEIK